MSGWGCPHEDRGRCLRRQTPCDPGAAGCVLEGRVVAGEKDRREGRPAQSTCSSKAFK
ncbi:MAG: hypothetical protein ACYDA8_15300 [Deferrisomatales bacterium]